MVENAAEIRLVVRFGSPVGRRRLRVAPIQAGAAHDGALADRAILGEFGRPELGHDSSTLRGRTRR
jgi:hypothetical protein